jgi:hypothetical protein
MPIVRPTKASIARENFNRFKKYNPQNQAVYLKPPHHDGFKFTSISDFNDFMNDRAAWAEIMVTEMQNRYFVSRLTKAVRDEKQSPILDKVKSTLLSYKQLPQKLQYSEDESFIHINASVPSIDSVLKEIGSRKSPLIEAQEVMDDEGIGDSLSPSGFDHFPVEFNLWLQTHPELKPAIEDGHVLCLG